LFLIHTRELAPHRDFVRELFKPLASIQARIDETIAKLRSTYSTVVGIHVRRGDFVTSDLRQSLDLLTPLADYTQWLDSIWPSLPAPVLLIATDSPSMVLPAFERFAPQTATSLGLRIDDLVPKGEGGNAFHQLGQSPSADFFPDWSLLTQCDVLAISNSTFSFTASLMNERARRFVRPTFDGSDLIPYDPWASEPLLMMEPSRSLVYEAVRRIRLRTRALGPASIPGSTLLAMRTYLKTLHYRLATCRHLFGTTATLCELARPSFYLQAGRRYQPQTIIAKPASS
jgi:hypothetical protein